MDNYGIFDTHVHLDDEQFDNDREELIKALPLSGISKVTNVGSSMATSLKSIQLAEKYDFIYAAVGVHPYDIVDMTNNDVEVLYNYTQQHKKVVAIGEIGLDYHYDNISRENQKKWFIKQMKLAKNINLPVILHLRDAFEDSFDIIKYFGQMPKGGVVHCFSGSTEFAKEVIKLGYKIGVGGVVTFNNAKKLVNVVSDISLDDILIETDCPYMAPVPNRGKRNNPTYTKFVAEKIADIKKIPLKTIVKTTCYNSNLFFGI